MFAKKGGIMKRILLILATLLALSAYAEHEYIPYVEEGKVWVSFEASGSIYKQVGIGEPTEINNTLYNKLYISTLDAKTNEVIQEFSSAKAAGDYLGKPKGNSEIIKVCKHYVSPSGRHYITALGYKWKYKNEGSTTTEI